MLAVLRQYTGSIPILDLHPVDWQYPGILAALPVYWQIDPVGAEYTTRIILITTWYGPATLARRHTQYTRVVYTGIINAVYWHTVYWQHWVVLNIRRLRILAVLRQYTGRKPNTLAVCTHR